MRARSWLAGTMTALILLAGCGAAEATREAQALADRLFQARGNGSGEAALAFYGDPFFAATPKDDWVRLTANLDRKLGRPESHSLEGWYVSVNRSAGVSGTYVTHNSRVHYAKADGVETIVVWKPRGGQVEIVGHRFDSPALLDGSIAPPADAKDDPSGA
jgi:hypothetical protein